MADKFIDIDNLLKEKSPKLKKWIPSFVVRYLKRVLHQNEINQILIDNKNNTDYDFCVSILSEFNIKVNILGTENIPKEGGAIFTSNHPLGGMDALAIVKEITPYRKDLKFVVNDILLNLKNLEGLFVGVNKHGTNSKQSILDLNKVFASENIVFVFPSGLVSRKSKGVVKDLTWKKTVITRSKKFKKNIIPIHIDGELSNFFYRLSNIRTKLGIKANIEMLYLIDETLKQKNKTYTITIGEPLLHSTFNKTKTDLEWAKFVKEKVYSLKK
jgi:putative hemolysin